MAAEMTSELQDHRVAIMAQLIVEGLRGTADGHCARVDFLDRAEAEAVCRRVRLEVSEKELDLGAYVLTAMNGSTVDPLALPTDRAIELRNRKRGRLCLFVPADLVDATASSLGNSFAEISGRMLHRLALDRVVASLGVDAREVARRIRSEVTRGMWASDDEILDFSVTVADHERSGELGKVGLQLCRVGLIADRRTDFLAHLSANRHSARLLSRPQRLGASYRERIAALGVSSETARELEMFFARRPLHDVRTWSRELAEGAGRTFDEWVFPDAVRTNLKVVRVQPFTDDSGAVLRTTKLLQPDGPGGMLLAQCGEKQVMNCRWETEPPKPDNVFAWTVSIVPAGGSEDLDDTLALLDLPSKEVEGAGRTTRVKLDLEFDEPPESSVVVRVAAIDQGGNELVDDEGQTIAAVSQEFYLTLEGPPPPGTVGTRRRTVASIAEGRVRAATEVREGQLVLSHPEWSESGDVSYFSVRANQHTVLNIATSRLLVALERLTISDPRCGGRWRLELDEVCQATAEMVVSQPVPARDEGAWSDFWRSRSSFFDKLGRVTPRDVLAAADWTQDLIDAALRYARAYNSLVSSARADDLREALSVDTLIVRIAEIGGGEEAAIVMPTHPLRVAWQACHAALLKGWEERLLQKERRERRGLVDLELMAGLRPTNMPAFVLGLEGEQPFLFYKDLGFYCGVAFPADAQDPARRYQEVAQILGAPEQGAGAADTTSERLSLHLRDFLKVHPYADPLRVTLVNPDQGELIAAAVEGLTRSGQPLTDDEEPVTVPRVEINARTLGAGSVGLKDLDRLRTRERSQLTRYDTDYLQPALATSVSSLTDGTGDSREESHVTVVSDLSRPDVRTIAVADAEKMSGGLSLYGLISRFAGTLQTGEEKVRWLYTAAATPTVKLDSHPAGQRFSDLLVELQGNILRAVGKLLKPASEVTVIPCVEVELDRDQVRLIEELHQRTDWMITVDRFLGVEFYDSPMKWGLDGTARKYLIDYSPEFSDGLGHRVIVTTAWRDEVAAILRRAMGELGFATIDQSVGKLLQYLKTISGRLALKAMSPESSGTAAVSLGAVMAWLQSKRRLEQAVLVPVDSHLGIFGPNSAGAIEAGQRRCDLALFTLRRGIVEASFIEVKWRRGPLGDIDDLVQDMALQMKITGETVERRFFDGDRTDGALQRAHLANVLRFYCRRAERYGLLDTAAATTFLGYLAQFEKSSLEFRPNYEGFVVSLEDAGRRPVIQGDVTVTVLTAREFEQAAVDLVAPTGPKEEGSGSEIKMGKGAVSEETAPKPVAGNVAKAEDEASAQPTENGGEVSPTRRAENDEDSENATGTQENGGEQRESATAEVEVPLGDSATGEVIWKPSVQGSPHLFITGIPGQGKSWTVLRLLTELSRNGVPALVLDFHGQLGNPSNQYVRVANPAVMDAAIGLPFSPFECTTDQSASGWNATAMGVAEIFGYVCGLGEIQQDALFTCIRDAYRAYGFGTGTNTEPIEFPSLPYVLRSIEQAERQKRTQNLLARCRPLLEMDIFHPAQGQQINLMEILVEGLVIDVHRLASETLQLAAGAFLLRKVYRDMFQWGQAERLRLVIVLDEAHRLAKDVTLPKIMKEGRKFGVAVVAASQGLADFHAEVVSNAGTKVAFRANYPESRKVAGFFRGRPGQDLSATLEGLGVGQALVQTPEMQTAVKARMRPPA